MRGWAAPPHPRIYRVPPPLPHTTCTSSKGHDLWFVIGGFLSVLFVSRFKVRNCFVIVLFRAINNRLVKFATHLFLNFLILVTCKNKATSASFIRQKLHSPSRFPLLFLARGLESFSANLLGEHVTLWFSSTPPSLKWSTEQKNTKSLWSLQYSQFDMTNFAVSKVSRLLFKSFYIHGYRNNIAFLPYKSLYFECYTTVPMVIFRAWATCAGYG